MNTYMYNHPITKTHLETVTKFGIIFIPPISKTLICGDAGIGAMANIDTIIYEARYALFKQSKWSWRSIGISIAILTLVTLSIGVYSLYSKKKSNIEIK